MLKQFFFSVSTELVRSTGLTFCSRKAKLANETVQSRSGKVYFDDFNVQDYIPVTQF